MNQINLSTYIKSRRQNIGLSQSELAKKLEVNRSLICKWESDQSQPSWYNFVKLCVVLGMNIDDFVKEVE